MLSGVSAQGRIWILLVAWGLFTGLCWADTFDLSDDIPLPGMVEQAMVAVESEERTEVLLSGIFLPSGALISLAFFRAHDFRPTLIAPHVETDPPLYQRHAVYRI